MTDASLGTRSTTIVSHAWLLLWFWPLLGGPHELTTPPYSCLHTQQGHLVGISFSGIPRQALGMGSWEVVKGFSNPVLGGPWGSLSYFRDILREKKIKSGWSFSNSQIK